MKAGVALLAMVVLGALAAPVIAPNDPDLTHHDLPFAPPSRIRVIDPAGGLAAPYTCLR